MSATLYKKGLSGLAGLVGLAAAADAAAGWDVLNMPEGVTSLSRGVQDLHMLILWICVAIGVVVFGAMIYSIVKFRKSKGAKAAQFHENTAVEIIWTIIPFLILVGMAIPATNMLITMEDTSNADMTIKVTGYQWKWQYEYMDGANNPVVGFYSNLATPRAQIEGGEAKDENYLLEVDNRLIVPVGKKIRFLFTAGDVIHAWWVPDLGWKKDAIPGYINKMWATVDEPGVYRGQCAELCGKDHGYMPVVVEAVPQDEFQQWLEKQKAKQAAANDEQPTDVSKADEVEPIRLAANGPLTGLLGASGAAPSGTAAASEEMSMEELMGKGAGVYRSKCQSCHQAQGQGIPGAFPALKGGPITTGDVGKHIDMVLNGSKGTAMRAFRSELSDEEIAAVITYERNSWGNDTGDVVTPADIKAAR